MAYNEFAYFYDEFNGEADYDALYSQIHAKLEAHGIHDGTVADLGCGTGELTLMLTQAGYDMIGIDQSEEMLCVIRDKAEQLGLSGRLLLLRQDLLKLARRATGSPIVTEIMNTEHLPLFENVDLIQVGARNMQNFELLKAVGRQKKPVLLKRGLANTLEEFVMSAEYIMAEGNENVILCERGIRTFETSMRNTLDLAGVVMLHKMTHLPVVVDPSHACGHAWMVPELAKAAVAAGADGLMIEVHNNPAKAKCDGAQSLTPDQFDELMQFIGKEVEFFGKKMN